MRITHTFLSLAVILLLIAPVVAQEAAPVPTQTPGQGWYLVVYNLLSGAVLSFLVTAFKNSQWIKDHAKLVAFILSILATVIPAVAGLPFAADGLGMIAVSIATQFMAAVGTHEAGVRQAQKLLGKPTTRQRG